MPEVEEMINLAYLTEAERELILEVLHRDAELRKNEEQRIRWGEPEIIYYGTHSHPPLDPQSSSLGTHSHLVWEPTYSSSIAKQNL